MSTPSSPPPTQQPPRGRGKSRGGLGKYLRARGKRGYRPAEFSKRLLLEGEGPPSTEDDDEEAEQIAAENAKKYARRQLTSNADRYEEPEPELGSDGEPIVEPEVDLSTFLEKQKLSDGTQLLKGDVTIDDDDKDIDHDIAPLGPKKTAMKKGKVEQIEWTPDLEALHREKMSAEAVRNLKERFKAKAEKLRAKPVFPTPRERRAASSLVEAPLLPLTDPPVPKDPMKEMEDFLDELLQ